MKKQYLDKGFVEVIDHLGDDTLFAMAARASFNQAEYVQTERNRGLINYLVEHHHNTPLEMGEIIFRVKIPLFVARQHMRHRTANINEQSLRYVTHDGDYYVPDKKRVKFQHQNKKQGSGESMPDHLAETVIELITSNSEDSWKKYNLLIKAGVANELARIVIPTNFYTTLVWKIDIHNLFHYLYLRTDREHAQEEIADLADILLEFTEELYPMATAAWREYRQNAVTFSRTEMDLLRKIISENKVDLEHWNDDGEVSFLGPRRFETFAEKLRFK